MLLEWELRNGLKNWYRVQQSRMWETEYNLCALLDKYSTEQFLFRNRRSNAIRKIIKISKFTKRTIEQIQTLQPYLQIDTEYILYPAYYDRKNNQNLLYKKDAEFQYI